MSDPKSRYADNRGVRIHYLDTGEDGSTPVVFVPGLSCVAHDYVEVLEHFGRRVVVIDLRGRGLSHSPPTGYHRDDHVSDIIAVLDDAAIDRYHLATFSRGTAYALPAAFGHPDRVRSISIGDYFPGELGIAGGAFADTFLNGRWRGTPVSTRISRAAVEGVAEQSVDRRYWTEIAQLEVPIQVARACIPRDGRMLLDAEMLGALRAAVPDVNVVDFLDSPHDIFRPDRTRYPKMVAALAHQAEQ